MYGYFFIFSLLFISFILVYIRYSGFVEYSGVKAKINILFIGQKETKISNLYDILQELLGIILLIALIGLSDNRES